MEAVYSHQKDTNTLEVVEDLVVDSELLEFMSNIAHNIIDNCTVDGRLAIYIRNCA
jgi:hypothetical protein